MHAQPFSGPLTVRSERFCLTGDRLSVSVDNSLNALNTLSNSTERTSTSEIGRKLELMNGFSMLRGLFECIAESMFRTCNPEKY